jgi:membrane-associated PAP2 superfamily phosphatase
LSAPGLRRDVAAVLAAAVAILAWDAVGLDLAIARWFGDAHGFAWREAWLTRTLLHDGGRWAAGVLMAGLLLDALRPLVRGPSRRQRLRGVLASLACLLAVPALKRASATSCPWDLAEFGGAAAYVPHWAFGVPDGGGGQCFPSGHAVAAFAFFSGYFVLRDHRPALARAWLAAVAAVGLLFAGAQVARGAHYPSHGLWSAWLCWSICVLLHAGPRPVIGRHEASSDAPSSAADPNGRGARETHHIAARPTEDAPAA